MSAFPLEKPRPLGTRKRGVWVYRFQRPNHFDHLNAKILRPTLAKPDPLPASPLAGGGAKSHYEATPIQTPAYQKLVANLFPDFQYENTEKGWPQT
jgi:hypothetical protein